MLLYRIIKGPGLAARKTFVLAVQKISARSEPASDSLGVQSGLVAADLFEDFAGAGVE